MHRGVSRQRWYKLGLWCQHPPAQCRDIAQHTLRGMVWSVQRTWRESKRRRQRRWRRVPTARQAMSPIQHVIHLQPGSRRGMGSAARRCQPMQPFSGRKMGAW